MGSIKAVSTLATMWWAQAVGWLQNFMSAGQAMNVAFEIKADCGYPAKAPRQTHHMICPFSLTVQSIKHLLITERTLWLQWPVGSDQFWLWTVSDENLLIALCHCKSKWKVNRCSHVLFEAPVATWGVCVGDVKSRTFVLGDRMTIGSSWLLLRLNHLALERKR